MTSQILLRFTIGGIMTVLIYLFSKSPHPFMAAILPAFPLFTSISLYHLHKNAQQSIPDLTVLMLGTTLTLALFVLAFRSLYLKTDYWLAWIAGIIIWLATTSVIYFAWSK